MHNSNKVEVRESEIHGKGIFAKESIPAGEIIMVIEGEVINEDECIRRENEEDNVYIFWNGDNYIDTAKTEVIKYINHDCDYNCEVDDKDDRSLYLLSAVDIKPGDELTIDYGYEEIYEFCQCNSCRGEDKSA
jgi:SET domain-containing protein